MISVKSSEFSWVFKTSFVIKKLWKTWKKLWELGTKNWSRFVDDIFAIVKNKKDDYEILEFLNKLHTKMKISLEIE